MGELPLLLHLDDAVEVDEGAADDVGRERYPAEDRGVEAHGVVDLVGELAGDGRAALRERVAEVDVGRDPLARSGGDQVQLGLGGAGAEQLRLVGRGQPEVEAGGQAASLDGLEAVLGPQHQVPQPFGLVVVHDDVVVRPVLEDVEDERVGPGGELLDVLVEAGVHLDAQVGNSDAHVEPVGHAVVGEEGGGVRLDVQEQVGADGVALEEEIEVAAVAVEVRVGEVERDVAVAEALALEGVERGVGGVGTEAELALARGQGPLGEDGAEGVRAAVEDAQLGIEGVGEAARGGSEGEGGQLGGDAAVELGQRGLRPGLRSEVRGVSRVGQDDGIARREEPEEEAR